MWDKFLSSPIANVIYIIIGIGVFLWIDLLISSWITGLILAYANFLYKRVNEKDMPNIDKLHWPIAVPLMVILPLILYLIVKK